DISSKIKCVGTLDVNTPGAYELTYSVIDSDGNETTAKRIVNVNANNKPIISGVDDLVIKTGDSFNLMDGVNATDTEDGVITNLVNIKGTVDTSITGIYKLIYSVIDRDGNETVINREVRVRSNEKPIISGADDMTITLGYDFDKFISIIARDKEDGDLTSLVSLTGDLDINKVGVYNLIYSVVDDDGNTTSVNRKITVRSNDKPVIIGAKNIIIKVGDNFDNMYGVTATDTEDKDLTSLLTVKGNVDTSVLGTYNLIYSVIDSDNNITTSTRKITVRSNDKPVISGTTDKIIKIGEKFDNLLGIKVKDTEDGEITNRIIVDGKVDVNTIGEYNLTYSVTDDDGNITSVNRRVMVRSNNKPTIIGANNYTIKVGDAFNAMDGVIATDTEDVELTNSIQVNGSVDITKEGKYKLTYLVVDSDGNKSTVNRTIIVKSNEKPKIMGAKYTTIKIGDLFNERAGIIAKDKEDGDLTKNINIKGYVDINILGEYELTYSVIDKDGNISEFIRTVTVRSNEAPKILGVKNTIIKVGEQINLTEGITAIDKEDNDLTKSIKIVENFNNTVPGNYEIVYQVTDSDENSTTVKKSIIVQSNDKPAILGVENAIIKASDSFDPMDGVTVTDTEDGDLTNQVIIEGNVDINKIGDYELKYYSKDRDGNKVEATRIVTVRSNDKPIILNADYKTIKVGDY
ncbi:MAG: immunoglobulin-like domain-containing protein, partial [Sarcina sp.]